jgi:hypothetical protein
MHRHDENRRLWQYRAGEARIFESRDHIPSSEGWGDFPCPPDAQGEQGLDDIARELDARADKLNAAAEAAQATLKGDADGGQDRHDEIQSEGIEAGIGSKGGDARPDEARQGPGSGQGQGSKGQRLLNRKGR